MLDQPSSSNALWRIYTNTGIRPEYLLPVLFSESGFNPAIQNSAGYDYWGLNQISGSTLQRYGFTSADYKTWPASRQLNDVVLQYMAAQVRAYGPLKSGTRVYQANFLPATLKTATNLNSVIATRPAAGCPAGAGGVYCANKGLDRENKGTITVRDLSGFIGRAAASQQVKDAIAAAYAQRPENGPPKDPVLGEDFGSPQTPELQAGLSGGAADFLLGTLLFASGFGVYTLIKDHKK